MGGLSVDEKLARYRARMAALQAEGRAKPDMIAYKELKDTLTPPDTHGHLPEISPGTSFNNRGELAILGLHKQMMRGIDCRKDDPKGAFAVVLSGGYKDDADTGTTFWYTGEGGQQSSRQVSDQTWTGGNLALRRNCETKTPVRVFRGSRDKDVGLRYTYDGLYMVKQCKMEASQDGPLVCKFLMEGVLEQSVATVKVEFGALWGGGTRRSLESRSVAKPSTGRRKRRKVLDTEEGWRLEYEAQLKAIQQREHLLIADISGGQEKLPIPVFNEVDDKPAPEGLVYVKNYVWAPGVRELVAPFLAAEDARMSTFLGADNSHCCGLAASAQIMRGDASLPNDHGYKRKHKENYNKDGQLIATDAFGIYECPATCTSKVCSANKVVSKGMTLPLEVFKTANKGWGVRCRQNISAGDFVACYIGQLITDDVADQQHDSDHYLFAQDHFIQVYEDPEGLPPHKLPQPPPKKFLHIVNERRQNAQQQQSPQEPVSGRSPSQQPASNGACSDASSTGGPPERQGSALEDAANNHNNQHHEKPSSAGAAGLATALLNSMADATAGLAAACSGALGIKTAAAAAAAPLAPTTTEVSTEATAAAAAAAASPMAPSSSSSGGAAAGHQPDPYAGPAAPASGPLNASLDAAGDSHHETLLVVDAAVYGNVARYINHSCAGNMLIQPVFTNTCRNTLFYYIALFAGEDIPANTELTYNYGYSKQKLGRNMPCHCGTNNCSGTLL